MHGAADRALQEHTCGFPATVRKDKFTHPLYVLQVLPGLGHQACPCSSKNFGVRRFVCAGCTLLYTNRQTDRDSFLVETYRFNLPLDSEFTDPLRFMGRVPLECLECCGDVTRIFLGEVARASRLPAGGSGSGPSGLSTSPETGLSSGTSPL